jgi:hypothetical protein
MIVKNLGFYTPPVGTDAKAAGRVKVPTWTVLCGRAWLLSVFDPEL